MAVCMIWNSMYEKGKRFLVFESEKNNRETVLMQCLIFNASAYVSAFGNNEEKKTIWYPQRNDGVSFKNAKNLPWLNYYNTCYLG